MANDIERDAATDLGLVRAAACKALLEMDRARQVSPAPEPAAEIAVSAEDACELRSSVNAEREAERETEWRELHWKLRSLAQQRVALEAQEAGLLLEAEESRLHRRLGYTSFLEYMERELHYGPHAANERLRVARELAALPLIAEQFQAGAISFSAVRELTRVATPENEHLFLAKANGRTARDVERMVAGLRRGDDPEAKPDPTLVKRFIRLEVSATMYARYTRYRSEIDRQREDRISDEELCGVFLSDHVTDEVTPPRVQVAVTTCKSCKQSVVSANGEHVPIDERTAECLTCDATFIGDLESDELTRPKDHIPASLRRKVMQRDGFACVVPGCRSKTCLSVHHGRQRQFGGQHEMKNMYTLCDGHHMHDHHGRLVITGDAPDLTFTWVPDGRVETATTVPPLEFVDEESESVPRGTETSGYERCRVSDDDPLRRELPQEQLAEVQPLVSESERDRGS